MAAPQVESFLASPQFHAGFTIDDASSTTATCAIDDLPAEACDVTFDLPTVSDGHYIFRVLATDAAGNQSDVAVGFTVDSLSPQVSIESPTSGAMYVNTPIEAQFAAADAHLSSVECAIDSMPTAQCESPMALSVLESGQHTFTVTARDAAGRISLLRVFRSRSPRHPMAGRPFQYSKESFVSTRFPVKSTRSKLNTTSTRTPTELPIWRTYCLLDRRMPGKF